jgi:hypothetical protein
VYVVVAWGALVALLWLAIDRGRAAEDDDA